ncbi:Paxip1 [Symbiodinium sp. CCMP2592]|nr:Paxip1 [Symbiodinium sp. CCMP2592]
MEALAFALQLDGEEEVHCELQLEGDEEHTVVKIGRCPKGGLVVNHLGVSWVHAEIRLLRRDSEAEPQLCVRDVSANGTGLQEEGGSEDEVQWLQRSEDVPFSEGKQIVMPQKVKNKAGRPEDAVRRTIGLRLTSEEEAAKARQIREEKAAKKRRRAGKKEEAKAKKKAEEAEKAKKQEKVESPKKAKEDLKKKASKDDDEPTKKTAQKEKKEKPSKEKDKPATKQARSRSRDGRKEKAKNGAAWPRGSRQPWRQRSRRRRAQARKRPRAACRVTVLPGPGSGAGASSQGSRARASRASTASSFRVDSEPPKGEEVVDAEIKSDDEDVVLVTGGETAAPSARETEEVAPQPKTEAPAQEPPEPSLPAWVREGKRCNWFSMSLKRLLPVRITKVDHAKSVVIATFESDSAVWKSVHFLLLGQPDCPLRGPEPGQESSDEEEGRSRRTGRRSRTPDVWEQERRRVIATQAVEQRRKAAQEIERQKVQAAFEQRKKEAEEQRLKEEEEWRARLVERRKKEAAEEEERLRLEEEERQERKRKRKEEKDREKEKEKEREKERRSKQEAEEDVFFCKAEGANAMLAHAGGGKQEVELSRFNPMMAMMAAAAGNGGGFAMNQSLGMSKGAGKGKASHPKGYDHAAAKGQGWGPGSGAGGYSSGGGNYGACGGGYGERSEYSHGQGDGFTGASSRGSNAGGKGGAAYAGCGGGYGDMGGGCGNGPSGEDRAPPPWRSAAAARPPPPPSSRGPGGGFGSETQGTKGGHLFPNTAGTKGSGFLFGNKVALEPRVEPVVQWCNKDIDCPATQLDEEDETSDIGQGDYGNTFAKATGFPSPPATPPQPRKRKRPPSTGLAETPPEKPCRRSPRLRELQKLQAEQAPEVPAPAPRRHQASTGGQKILAEAPLRPVIALSGVEIEANLLNAARRLVESLGGEITNTWTMKATHLVACRLRRTFKIMCALCRGVPIVRPAFIKRCVQEARVPEVRNQDLLRDIIGQQIFAKRFLGRSQSYSLGDVLQRAHDRPLLANFRVYVLPEVTTMERPKLHALVEAAGGQWQEELPTAGTPGFGGSLLVFADAASPAASLAQAASCGAPAGVYQLESLLSAACTQDLRLQAFQMPLRRPSRAAEKSFGAGRRAFEQLSSQGICY